MEKVIYNTRNKPFNNADIYSILDQFKTFIEPFQNLKLNIPWKHCINMLVEIMSVAKEKIEYTISILKSELQFDKVIHHFVYFASGKHCISLKHQKYLANLLYNPADTHSIKYKRASKFHNQGDYNIRSLLKDKVFQIV